MEYTSDFFTQYEPELKSIVGRGGLVHPGVGLTKKLLENVRLQIRSKAEPWSTYFTDMLQSVHASKEICIYLTNPKETQYASQRTNGYFIKDGLTAYTQAVLYYVTGDNRYRKNALQILRAWSDMNPETYAYFTDACIHVGIPMNRMCMAAEIIRYSTYQTTEGYTDAELQWTDQEISHFKEYLLRPALETFLSSCDEFMNQHLYTVIGAMSAFLFLDDTDGYAKTVEWLTVNKNGKNPGFNGSIQRLFREITTVDELGEEEGSGRKLEKPVIQHVEMGRDQAHGCGDLTNVAILARMMTAQNTKVDTVQGTISDAEDAVGIYEFLDDRILKTADFFFRYMLGYDAEWVQTPFSIRDGKIVDSYMAFSPNYRGRYNTINFWDLYVYYTNSRPEVNLEKQYPYFYEGFMKKVPSNYFTKGKLMVNWNNADGGGDFWLFLPPEMKNDSKLLAKPQVDYKVEAEDRGTMVENKEAMSIQEEDGIGFIHFVKSPKKSRVAITTGGADGQTIAFCIRTDGLATLSLSNGVQGSIYLPDTEGRWEYVSFTRNSYEEFGDLYYIMLSDIQGSYVDIDAIDILPDMENGSRNCIDIISFEGGGEDIFHTAYQNAPICISFAAKSSISSHTVVYQGFGLLDGAVLNESEGLFEWVPDKTGNYSFYISAKSGKTSVLKKVEIEVAQTRTDSVRLAVASYDSDAVYTKASYAEFQNAWGEIRELSDSVSDEIFMAKLKILEEAVRGLKLVSPRLKQDSFTDGTSLDYPQMVYESTMGKELYNLTDGQGTFCGFYTAVDKAHIIDFGPDFKISATKFGFQARYGFSDRLAGVQVFGSNDKENWVLLTIGEAAYTQAYQEVDVREEEQGHRYRYLKICKTTEYPEALRGHLNYLLEFGELRIFGDCYEED